MTAAGRISGLIAFPRSWSFTRHGQTVRFQPKEFSLAFALCAAAPDALSNAELLDASRDPKRYIAADPLAALRQTMLYMRRKMRALGVAFDCQIGRGTRAVDLVPASPSQFADDLAGDFPDLPRAVDSISSHPLPVPPFTNEGWNQCDSRSANTANIWRAAE